MKHKMLKINLKKLFCHTNIFFKANLNGKQNYKIRIDINSDFSNLCTELKIRITKLLCFQFWLWFLTDFWVKNSELNFKFWFFSFNSVFFQWKSEFFEILISDFRSDLTRKIKILSNFNSDFCNSVCIY